MIRIYQRENKVRSEANDVINDVIKKCKNIINTYRAAFNGNPHWYNDCRVYCISGKLIAAGELEVNNFFSFLAAMMMAYQPIRSLATLNLSVFKV